MLKITVREAFEGTIDTTNHYLYLYRDGETIFYIGRSTCPLERLQEHVGMGAYNRHTSRLGALILAHLPQSLLWQIELRTVAECDVLVYRYRPEYYAWYLQQISKNIVREATEVAEEVLIEHYRPCLNVMGNRQRQALPERYR